MCEEWSPVPAQGHPLCSQDQEGPEEQKSQKLSESRGGCWACLSHSPSLTLPLSFQALPLTAGELFACPTFCPPDAAIVLRLQQLLAAPHSSWPGCGLCPWKACHGGALTMGSRSLHTLSNACGRFDDALGPLGWVTAASRPTLTAMGEEGGPALADFSE